MAKHDLGDMEKIRLRLEDWLRKNLPNAATLTLADLSFPEESGESSVSLILKAKTVSQNALQDKTQELNFICRMKPRNSEVFTEHDLPLQYNLMKMAGENGIPVPPLLGFEANSDIIGSDFYIMGFVDGQVPTDNPPYAFGSWVTELSDEERSIQWRNGLETLAKIHQIDLSAYDISNIPASAPDESPAQHEIDKFNALITDDIRGGFSPGLEEAIQFISDNAPPDGTRRLCWGDSRPGNIIWQDLKPNAVIDWEMANIGDPVQDVSWWYWIDYVNSVGFGLERLGGLPPLEDIYAQWHDLTGLSTAHSDFYDLCSVARYAIILERKFLALEKAGLDRIENFCYPFVDKQLEKCKSLLTRDA